MTLIPQRWTTFFAAAVLVAATAVVGAAQQEVIPERVQRTIDEMRARAELGDAEAQTLIGALYTEGKYVPQDDVESDEPWN